MQGMDGSEEEIYSIMFTSLKHPVRRKILRMLNDKSMTFMELADKIGVSSSNLTYHLENLGELIYKIENGRYKLSSFGRATVSAMKGVEETPEIEPKRSIRLSSWWRAIFSVLLIAVILLAAFSVVQFNMLNQFSADTAHLKAQNHQLLSWGVDTNKIVNLLQNVVQLDTSRYAVKLLDNTVQYRADLGVTEEIIKYSLTSGKGSVDANFRFRDNHISHYELRLSFDSQLYTTQADNIGILQTAKNTLEGYMAYSKDVYLDEMRRLLDSVNHTQNIEVTSDNMKLQIRLRGEIAEFMWLYTEEGVDFSPKSLRMVFQNRVLVSLIDGFFFYTIDSTEINVDQQEAVTTAINHIKTLTWIIDGEKISGFNSQAEPFYIEFVPHPRNNSVALVPYWYVVLSLDKTYPNGINQIAVGIYADNAEVADIEMLSYKP